MSTYDEIIEETKAVQTNFDIKKVDCKLQNFYILHTFFKITTVALISVNIYFYLIKYWANQNHLLPFHDTNSKLIICYEKWKYVLIICYEKWKLKMN